VAGLLKGADNIGRIAGPDQGQVGAARDRAGEVTSRCCRVAARQHEFLQPRQVGIPGLDRRLQALDLRLAKERMPGDADFAAQIEEVVLHLEQECAHLRGHVLGEDEADRAVQLIELAERMHPGMVFRDARAVAESRLTGVARARGDL
jgi:hypothetical protein